MTAQPRRRETTRNRLAPCFRALVVFALLSPGVSTAQTIMQRGFVEPRLFLFPQQAPDDPTGVVADVLAREEVFAKPTGWLQFAAGIEARADSHERVEDDFDFFDRTVKRPRLSVRRLGATISRSWLTLDVGKQFIRWGRTDLVTPTDRFAPRDFLDVVDNDFIGVTGGRAVAEVAGDNIDFVWVPRFTPSRMPLLSGRWTVVPPVEIGGERVPIALVDVTRDLPGGSQFGVRWNHPGTALEYSLSFFDGYNNLPNIETDVSTVLQDPALLRSLLALGLQPALQINVRRVYPAIRSYGGDLAVPTRWVTIKGEAAYVTSSTAGADEYVLYVLQIERQTGEWMFVGGYAGEAVTERRAPLTFAPDRGLTRSIVGRASYTIDPNRSVVFETAIRQNGRGAWVKAEYSQARGDHWRLTATAGLIAGHGDDFLGQYRRNSHLLLSARYSF